MPQQANVFLFSALFLRYLSISIIIRYLFFKKFGQYYATSALYLLIQQQLKRPAKLKYSTIKIILSKYGFTKLLNFGRNYGLREGAQ